MIYPWDIPLGIHSFGNICKNASEYFTRNSGRSSRDFSVNSSWHSPVNSYRTLNLCGNSSWNFHESSSGNSSWHFPVRSSRNSSTNFSGNFSWNSPGTSCGSSLRSSFRKFIGNICNNSSGSSSYSSSRNFSRSFTRNSVQNFFKNWSKNYPKISEGIHLQCQEKSLESWIIHWTNKLEEFFEECLETWKNFTISF